MLNIYLAGEIHSDWRNDIIQLTKKNDLNVNFSSPVTDHDASDTGLEKLTFKSFFFVSFIISSLQSE